MAQGLYTLKLTLDEAVAVRTALHQRIDQLDNMISRSSENDIGLRTSLARERDQLVRTLNSL